MTNEGKFWSRIVTALWKADRVLNRIENGVIDGMPDAYYTIDGASGWMELKCPTEPKRATTPLFSGNHPLSLAQRNWLIAHHQAGGTSWVAIETQSWVFLVAGSRADSINGWTLEQLKHFSDFWPRPMREQDWCDFLNILKNERTT
jgi:hypothetical protein